MVFFNYKRDTGISLIDGGKEVNNHFFSLSTTTKVKFLENSSLFFSTFINFNNYSYNGNVYSFQLVNITFTIVSKQIQYIVNSENFTYDHGSITNYINNRFTVNYPEKYIDSAISCKYIFQILINNQINGTINLTNQTTLLRTYSTNFEILMYLLFFILLILLFYLFFFSIKKKNELDITSYLLSNGFFYHILLSLFYIFIISPLFKDEPYNLKIIIIPLYLIIYKIIMIPLFKRLINIQDIILRYELNKIFSIGAFTWLFFLLALSPYLLTNSLIFTFEIFLCIGHFIIKTFIFYYLYR